jgi:DNA-binding sugar fermentation-stimulating protein
MPRARKTDKFFIVQIKGCKNLGNHLVGINPDYEGDRSNLHLQEFVDFLKEQGVDPSKIKLPDSFNSIFINK